MPRRPTVAHSCALALFLAAASTATALSASFVEDFEDGDYDFTFTFSQSHEIGSGVATTAWSVQGTSPNKVLHNHNVVQADVSDYSIVYGSQFFSAANAVGGHFKFSTDVSLSQSRPGKVDNPQTTDQCTTVALGVLGSGAFSPGSFAGFDDVNDGQHYYIAILTFRRSGDDLDPWSSADEGTLHLFEHNGDGQIDTESTKSIKALGGSFTFSIEGTYAGGTLTLEATINDGSKAPLSVSDSDTTPLTGAYFGMRTAAFTRSGDVAGSAITLDADFDNVSLQKDYQPDAQISKGNGNKFAGKGIVNTSGSSQQGKRTVTLGQTAEYKIRIANLGTLSDSFKLTGPGSSSGYTITYFNGNTNITNQVTGAGFTTNSLTPGQKQDLTIRVKTGAGASGTKTFKLNTRSTYDTNARDTVKAKVTVN